MKEPSLFDFPQYQINKKIRLIELFGGIGSQAMALRDLGADLKVIKIILKKLIATNPDFDNLEQVIMNHCSFIK